MQISQIPRLSVVQNIAIAIITSCFQLTVLSAQVYMNITVRVARPDLLFTILPSELSPVGVPVCATASRGGAVATATIDASGTARLTISTVEYGTTIRIFVNGGNTKSMNCGSKDAIVLSDLTGAQSEFTLSGEILRAIDRHETMAINIKLQYDGLLLKAQQLITQLLDPKSSLTYSQMTSKLDKILGPNSYVGRTYNNSSVLLKQEVLLQYAKSLQSQADEAFDRDDYDKAHSLYSTLVTNFSNSSSNSTNIERKIQLESIFSRAQHCDSLMNQLQSIPNNSNRLKFLLTSSSQLSSSDPCLEKLNELRGELEKEIESDSILAEMSRLKSEDQKAIKKFKVDKNASPMDFLTNPFAYKGKSVALSAVVEKFETPTSALMTYGTRTFYAVFKIPPPKKYNVLHLIVKVKGTTMVKNAYGTSVKVPHVDIVHILNTSP
ncbi:MAG: hypothetical protein HYY49_05095 [Ignavibacteriales bacterium]|nr:hypothetical protein [Ignavibacteriales bacterium]